MCLKDLFIFYMHKYLACCLLGTWGGQKRISDPLELDKSNCNFFASKKVANFTRLWCTASVNVEAMMFKMSFSLGNHKYNVTLVVSSISEDRNQVKTHRRTVTLRIVIHLRFFVLSTYTVFCFAPLIYDTKVMKVCCCWNSF